MIDDFHFHPGDQLRELLRKFLLRLNQSTLAPMSDATIPRPADGAHELSRKILTRLNEMVPTATGDVHFSHGDNLTTLWRKSLDVLNQAPAI